MVFTYKICILVKSKTRYLCRLGWLRIWGPMRKMYYLDIHPPLIRSTFLTVLQLLFSFPTPSGPSSHQMERAISSQYCSYAQKAHTRGSQPAVTQMSLNCNSHQLPQLVMPAEQKKILIPTSCRGHHTGYTGASYKTAT